MAYCLERTEAVRDGLRRIFIEEIDNIHGELSGYLNSSSGSIHEARKSLKKVRAILRLLRQDLGNEYKYENAYFRDCAHKLCHLRDHESLIEISDKLLSTAKGEKEKTQIKNVKRVGDT